MDPALFAYLESYLTESRKARLREVLARRTRHVALVLDDIYQPHNVSAVLRSCDAFGVQDVFLVDREADQKLSADVAAGSDKWLTLHRLTGPDAAERCVAELRRRGYRIAATAPGGDAVAPDTISIDTPLAVVIGHESHGISAPLLAAADERLSIPMYGFVESFNLSVAAALCLQDLTRRLRASDIPWQLPAADQEQLLCDWTRASVAHVAAIEARWRREQPGTGG